MADMSLESTLEKVDNSRVLYVCILFHGNDASHSVYRIKVGDLLVSNWEDFSRVADLGGENLPHWMNSAMFGSKILVASGFKASGLEVEFSKVIFSFDPFDPANGFENQDNAAVKNFTAGKSNPILVEVKGKLYALAGLPFEPFDNLPKLSFEVYDPACSLPSAGDRSNIILRVPRSNHKEQGKFKDNIIK